MQYGVRMQAGPDAQEHKVGLLELALAFVAKANFTYGGGSATIATLYGDLVERRRWLTQAPFVLAYALSRLTPGTNLLGFIACIGYVLRRTPGMLVALIAGSVPCAAMALGLTAVYDSWSDDAVAQVAIRGALAAAVAVTIITGVILVRPFWRSAGRGQLGVFVGGAFAAAQFAHVTPLLVLLVAALAGLAWPARTQR
jgi:chromate transporter